MTAPLLQLEGVSKRYGATLALDRVNFDLNPGEVHALMGENGAGKSTLMKILAGNVAADSGRILIEGKEVAVRGPEDAARLGIAIIHQELNTVPDMTVAENLALGKEPKTRFGFLDRKRIIDDAKRKLARIHSDIEPTQKLGTLSVGLQQMVEIARAVGENARVLVLDEPTAALSRSEAQELYRLVGEMRRQGVAMVYISHRMEEVWLLSDRITVFRDGRDIGTAPASQLREADVVNMMVGREIGALYAHAPRQPGETLLETRGLTGAGVGPVDLQLRAGEVVCLAGLIGSGRTEFAKLIFGADPRLAGSVWIRGRESQPADPVDAIRDGIGMVPEDRKAEGLFLEHTVRQNIAISSLGQFSTAGVIRGEEERKAVLGQMAQLSLRATAIDLPAKALSGGNQQKAALARWLLRDCDVLILDEPTRGVDIGAKREIYETIDALARAGKALLIISSDLPEAIGISDRLMVMRQGRFVAELQSSQATEEDVMLHATCARNPAV